MWVLEARSDAEKIWFPVVWEATKDNSDVVDYNIREEQTIEQSSVFDANNNTTTWMANVIPWVNAPKLIESTSIYNNVPSKSANAVFNGSWGFTIQDIWTVKVWLIRPIAIISQSWWYTYTVWDYFNWYSDTPDTALIIPASWVYLLKVTYYSTVNGLYRYYDVYKNLDVIKRFRDDTYYDRTWSAYPTEEVYISANKGDQIATYFNVYANNSWYIWMYASYQISIDITKLS